MIWTPPSGRVVGLETTSDSITSHARLFRVNRKVLKLGLGMDRMPCGQFWANAVFFRIGILAYNLFRMFELKVLPEDWHRHQIRTVRWRLYQVAGKVARHAGQVCLKVRQAYYGLFEMIRRRIRIVAMA